MNYKIAIIGLGYVGLPLAVEFAKKYLVYGLDIDVDRVNRLKAGFDDTQEVYKDELLSVLSEPSNNGLVLTTKVEELENCNTYIVTVPTPIDTNKNPDLSALINATSSVGSILKKKDIVIYESTVFPGATEDICVPILEKFSGLKFNKSFFCGYSPERVNPGDKDHTITKIKKLTSGSTPEVARIIDNLYDSIILAGTHPVSSIRIAEAAKVIENAQRDVNIAFVNELAKIFSKLEIDTHAVLDAAATKWNFLPFKPGLVGGHCIGVDPYYLAQKAQEIGYHPEIILAGRRLNDSMGDFVVTELIKLMTKKEINIKNAKALMLGITFKENCPDIRNTGAINIYKALVSFNICVDVYDPIASHKEVKTNFDIDMVNSLDCKYDVIIHVVAHDVFTAIDLEQLRNKKCVVYDVKGTLPINSVSKRL